MGSHEHACLCKCVWARPRGIGGVRGISENRADFMAAAGGLCVQDAAGESVRRWEM